MDAVPVVNFALNVVNFNNNTGQTAQHPGYVTGFNQVLVGKYYTSATEAYRARVAINTNSTKTSTFFDDPTDTSAEPGELEDAVANRNSTVILGAGMEYRRGHNRLQGFYGAEALLSLSGSSTVNTYGLAGADALADGDSRVLSSSTGMGFGIGARGFAGVEYFAAPKISIGAEFGWGLGLATSGRGTTEVESNNGGTIEVTETEGTNSMRMFGFGVDSGAGQTVLGGGTAALTINFHI